jgi:hypothetical protein
MARVAAVTLCAGFRTHELADRLECRGTPYDHRDGEADGSQPPGAHHFSIWRSVDRVGGEEPGAIEEIPCGVTDEQRGRIVERRPSPLAET